MKRMEPSPDGCEMKGSGVVIAVKRTTLVLTAAHVADVKLAAPHKSPQQINEEWQFTLWDPAGRQYDGAYVASVPYFPPDLALLRIDDEKAKELTPVPLAVADDLPPTRLQVMGFQGQAFSLSESELPLLSMDGGSTPFGGIRLYGRIDQPFGISGGPIMADGKLWGILSISGFGTGPEDNFVAGPSHRAIRNMLACWLAGAYQFADEYLHPKIMLLPLPADVTETLRGAV